MAGDVVSVVAERMIALLEEQATYHINLVRGAEKEVGNLAKELKTVRNVLDDAERRGYKEKSIKDWLSRLEQTSYEMEDVLDEWDYAILKLRMEGDQSGDAAVAAPKKKVWSFIPSSSCLCCKKVVVRHGIAKKIIDVKEKLDEVLKEKDRYGFVMSQPMADVSHNSWRDPSTSFTDLEVVCGRDSDRDILVTKLMGRQEELGIQVVSIVGVGGLGKTTLAQLVYNDTRVEKNFPLMIWICVSDPFDLAAIAKGILEGVGRESSSIPTQLDVLLKDVKESIFGKRFLLVLDDVWTEDAKKWQPLKASLRCGGEGSTVLVTTRNERVAKAMGTIENDIYRPQLLSLEDCWSLLCRISFSGRSEEERERFEEIGKNIASKCEGLPLAACVLGSLLQFKNSLEEWESVFESEIWELEEAEIRLFPHLLLSYNQLSPPLRRCFSYCAVFPKDFEINVDKLIENWIAQGYLGSDVGDMELKGQEYFQNLAMRSLFQDFEREDFGERIISCKMHDIVHDFAKSLRKDRSSIRVEAGKKATCERCSFSLVSSVKTYRSLVSYDHSYICDCLTSLRVLRIANYHLDGIPQEMKHLIHLRWLDLSHINFSMEDFKIICKLYNLQFLRLHDCDLEEVPSEIEHLIQLRHLDLSSNSLMNLPEQIGNLIQLTHLNLSFNDSLEELPDEIRNLIQLRHLNIQGNLSLKELPESVYGLINLKHILNQATLNTLFFERLSKLTGLRTLSEYSGGRGCGRLAWLKNLNLLSGSLQFYINLVDDSKDMVADAREADLRNKMHLRTLTIYFRDVVDEMDEDEESNEMGEDEMDEESNEMDEENDEMDEENDLVWVNLLDALEPHPNLQNLDIKDYKGSKLGEWITSPLIHLRSIRLSLFNRVQSLPPFGKLPRLEEMEIWYFKGLQFVGREFLGLTAAGASSNVTTVGFPKLKILKFEDCGKWKEWEDITAEEEDSASVTLMPCLTELVIENCNSLTALPERLLGKKSSSLEYVQIEADDLSTSLLIKRYQEREGATWVGRGYYRKLQVSFGPK